MRIPLPRRRTFRGASTWRRHRMAGAMVVLIGLVAVGGLYSLVSPEPADADNSQRDLVEKGRELFLVGCSSCHGLNGEGVLANEEGDRNYGPSLVGVGAAAVDFQVGTGRMPLAQVGPEAQRKRVVYTDEEIEALAAYVASLGPGPAIPDEEYTNVSGLSDEEMAEGGEFFRTNCTACHNSVGAGGALPEGRSAPSVKGVENKHIYEAMITGPGQMPVFSDEVITPEDKRKIIGYIKALEEEPEHGGFSFGGFGPVSDGIVTFVVGLGVLVGFAIWIGAHGVRAGKSE